MAAIDWGGAAPQTEDVVGGFPRGIFGRDEEGKEVESMYAWVNRWTRDWIPESSLNVA